MRGHKNARIGIIGDFCVDIYWHADMRKSELSRETPHYPLPIVGERVYLGAGGNVAANLAALAPKELLPYRLSAATGAVCSWRTYSKRAA